MALTFIQNNWHPGAGLLQCRDMRFAICNEIFQGWPLAKAMAYARQCGYDAIEIAPFTLAADVTKISPAKRQEIRTLAVSTGLAIAGIHWVLVGTDGLHVTHPDPAVRARTAAYFVALTDFCADIGGQVMVLGSPKQRNLGEGISSAQGLTWAREVLQPAVTRAGERGVTICFEPLAPAETNFINTAEAAFELVRSFQSTAAQIILDVKAMSAEAKPIPQIIRESAPGFAHFHANDSNLKGPGFGDVDFRPIAAALKEVGYTGYVSVEVFKFEEGPEAIATRSLEYLRQVWAEVG